MNPELPMFSPDQLSDRCAEEASKKDARNRDDQYCFELIRRAFGLEDNYSLSLVLNIYKTIWTKSWVRNPQMFDTHPVTTDDFKSIAFFKVYQQIKGGHFDSFPSLNSVLFYLNKTLVRVIAAYYRSLEMRQYRKTVNETPDAPDPLEYTASSENLSQDVERNLAWQDVQKRVDFLLPHEADRTLFDCWAKQNLSRAEIIQTYGRFWANENEVRVALQRIQRRLFKDTLLHDILKDLRGIQ